MSGSDIMSFLDKQIREAKDNYNYFFMRLFFSVLKIILKLLCVLLISGIFNYLFINIIALIYTIYSLYCLYDICNYYFNIICEIKETLRYNEFSFVIDFCLVNNSILKGILKYGK